MCNYKKSLLQQEIEELTDLLRNNPDWNDLRKALLRKNINPDDILLAGFMEDEENHKFGVIVTQNGEILNYERDTAFDNFEFSKWEKVKDIEKLSDTFPAVKIALKII